MVEVLADNEGMFKGLLFQDKQMIQAVSAYSELLCLDATYKLHQLCLPVFLMLVKVRWHQFAFWLVRIVILLSGC